MNLRIQALRAIEKAEFLGYNSEKWAVGFDVEW
jgi:hypothetical protein